MFRTKYIYMSAEKKPLFLQDVGKNSLNFDRKVFEMTCEQFSSAQSIYLIKKTVVSHLVHTTRFWNNLIQMCSITKYWKPKLID